jgi:hypothetical protein
LSIQQLVILSPQEASEGGLAPLGTRGEILTGLSKFNTAPDKNGGDVLYGPGISIELPPSEPVTQMLLTVVEEEIAWQVILRLAKEFNWKLLDPVSGRELTP